MIDVTELKINGYHATELIDAMVFAKKHGWRSKQEEEKPPMRVYQNIYGFVIAQKGAMDEKNDVTEELAAALAPYIKKELGL